uniref:hypothetical protein n=1 Tax=Frankia sp. Cj3 TaxID=2880976 RepID=UPI001EF4EE26
MSPSHGFPGGYLYSAALALSGGRGGSAGDRERSNAHMDVLTRGAGLDPAGMLRLRDARGVMAGLI